MKNDVDKIPVLLEDCIESVQKTAISNSSLKQLLIPYNNARDLSPSDLLLFLQSDPPLICSPLTKQQKDLYKTHKVPLEITNDNNGSISDVDNHNEGFDGVFDLETNCGSDYQPCINLYTDTIIPYNRHRTHKLNKICEYNEGNYQEGVDGPPDEVVVDDNDDDQMIWMILIGKGVGWEGKGGREGFVFICFHCFLSRDIDVTLFKQNKYLKFFLKIINFTYDIVKIKPPRLVINI
jgi:hypothetical protein